MTAVKPFGQWQIHIPMNYWSNGKPTDEERYADLFEDLDLSTDQRTLNIDGLEDMMMMATYDSMVEYKYAR